MERDKVDAQQTTLTQIVRKETRRRQAIQPSEHSIYRDDVTIGQDVRRLLKLPDISEATKQESANNCVTPVGKMHAVDDIFLNGFKPELYEDSETSDDDFASKRSKRKKTKTKNIQRKRKAPPPASPASDNISVDLLPLPSPKTKKNLSSQTIARQYNLLLDENLKLRRTNDELNEVITDNNELVSKCENMDRKYDQACQEVRYLRYQLDIINLASKQPTMGQIGALDLSGYEGWIGPRPQD